MMLATFTDGSAPQLGVVIGDKIVPVAGAGADAPATMIDLIAGWDAAQPALAALGDAGARPLAEVTLLPPIPRPGKIMALGQNYADHIKEMGSEPPSAQVWFCKQLSAVNAPFAPIQIPRVSDKIDYEVELVVVIGKRGRHIAHEAALDHVFGYCVGNDVSVRDWQKATPQWVLGKSFDTHAPFGPWITTADEIGDPHRLGIRSLVNGEVRQDSNTRELIFTIRDQIAHLSKAMTLEPGDLIYSGTPGGVGAGFSPPKFLKVGDTIRCEIDELGAIEAVCEAE